MRGARSENGQTLLVNKSVLTPKSYQEGLATLITLSRELLGDQELTGAVIGVAGTVDNPTNALGRFGYLREWDNQPLASDYQREFNINPLIRNDAELAALGEATFGAGKNLNSFIYFTIGTGVGGAWVKRDGANILSENIEAGHEITIDPTGPVCKLCGTTGDIETTISGTSLAKRHGKPAAEINDPEAWAEVAKFIALGIAATLKKYPAEAAIIGGGIIARGRISFPEIEKKLIQLYENQSVPGVLKATLGDQSGLYGALALIK